MKTKEELNAIKEEVESLRQKITELTDEELSEVSGGVTATKLTVTLGIKKGETVSIGGINVVVPSALILDVGD